DPGLDVLEDAPTGLCTPDERRCADSLTVETCLVDGTGWTATACPNDQRCDADALACRPVVCVAGTIEGCAGPNSFEVCNQTGTATFTAQCPGNSPCTEGACEEPLCPIGSTQCADLE